MINNVNSPKHKKNQDTLIYLNKIINGIIKYNLKSEKLNILQISIDCFFK